MLFHLHSFITLIFRLNTLVVILLAVGATCACYYLDFTFDITPQFISVGIVFPISFGIQFSFNRRERVLLDISSLRASAFSLYALSREWPPQKNPKKSHSPKNISETDSGNSDDTNEDDIKFYGTDEGEHCEKMKQLLSDLLMDISKYVSHNDPKNIVIYTIYAKFDAILHLLEDIRASDEWIKSVISRAYQYVRYMINDFERIRTVTDYRTPSTFRGFSFIMLTFIPIVYAPSFANIGKELSQLAPAVYSAFVITLLYVALNNIMEGLEDPFDGIGVDDFNVAVITEPILFLYKPVVKGTDQHFYDNIRLSRILKRRKYDDTTDTVVSDVLKENNTTSKSKGHD